MTKMAATLIYDKNPLKIFFEVIILTWYVKPNETMAINKFQRSRPPHLYVVKPL